MPWYAMSALTSSPYPVESAKTPSTAPCTSRPPNPDTLHTVHGQRLQRKYELRQAGIPVTKPTYIVRVEPSAIAIPDWIRAKAVKGMPGNQCYIWLQWGMAIKLARLDRQAFGKPDVMRVEHRVCKICKRHLLGPMARERRMLDESCLDGTEIPCGHYCHSRKGKQ